MSVGVQDQYSRLGSQTMTHFHVKRPWGVIGLPLHALVYQLTPALPSCPTFAKHPHQLTQGLISDQRASRWGGRRRVRQFSSDLSNRNSFCN